MERESNRRRERAREGEIGQEIQRWRERELERMERYTQRNRERGRETQ